jgi:hypothetical protein
MQAGLEYLASSCHARQFETTVVLCEFAPGYGSFKNPYPRVSTYMMRSRQSLLRAEDYLGNQGNQVRRSSSEVRLLEF